MRRVFPFLFIFSLVFLVVGLVSADSGGCFSGDNIKIFSSKNNSLGYQEQLEDVQQILEHTLINELVENLKDRNFRLEIEDGVVVSIKSNRIALIPLNSERGTSIFEDVFKPDPDHVVKKFLVMGGDDFSMVFFLEIEVAPESKSIMRFSLGTPDGYLKTIYPQERRRSETRRFKSVYVSGGTDGYDRVDGECASCVVKKCLWTSEWCSWATTLVINCSDCWLESVCDGCYIAIAQVLECYLVECNTCKDECGPWLPDIPSLEFSLIPAGNFIMGSPIDEPGRQDDEYQHEVTLTKDYMISKYEITNNEYVAVLQWAFEKGYVTVLPTAVKEITTDRTIVDIDDPDCKISFDNGAFYVEEGYLDMPVVEVSWFGAACYCNWLSELDNLSPQYVYDYHNWTCYFNGSGYRLPTEAEWEYAARAGSQTAFYNGDITEPYGDDPNMDMIGWYIRNSYSMLHFGGLKEPNAWDLYDMSGNCIEWCNDWLGDYPQYSVTDPVGPETGIFRILRGGGWTNDARNCRSAHRRGLYSGNTFGDLSFRVVKPVEE